MQLQNKFLAIAKQLYDKNIQNNPAVYVGTYKKYNEDNLNGQWVNLTKFDNYEKFLNYCKEIHKDEKNPQFMFQDFQNFPEKYYHENSLDEEIWDYIQTIKTQDKDVVDAVIDNGGSLQEAIDAYVYYNCDNMTDVAYRYIDDIGGIENIDKKTLERYFNYQSYGRDMQMSSSFVKYKDGYIQY